MTFNTQLNCNWQEYYNTHGLEQKGILIDSTTVVGYVKSPARFKVNEHNISEGSKSILANSQNASYFDNLRVRKISTCKGLRVRIMQIFQTFGKNLPVVSPICQWKKILLTKLCKWIKKLTSSPVFVHKHLILTKNSQDSYQYCTRPTHHQSSLMREKAGCRKWQGGRASIPAICHILRGTTGDKTESWQMVNSRLKTMVENRTVLAFKRIWDWGTIPT